MKQLTTIIILLFLSLYSYSQLFQIDQYGVSLYEKGSKLLESGDYYGADSVLTEAMCTYKNANTYYNRAIARLLLTDTIGFCEDMNTAANKYFDNGAAKTFNNMCCKKVDTIFYNRKRIVVSSEKYRYYEVILDLKYEELIIGKFHDVKHDGLLISSSIDCDDNIQAFNGIKSTLIASYQIENGKKYYTKTLKSPSTDSYRKQNQIDRKGVVFLESKYAKFKASRNIEKLKVSFIMYISEFGFIEDITSLNTYNKNIDASESIEELLPELHDDILNIVKRYPTIVPAKFYDEKVSCKAFHFLEF